MSISDDREAAFIAAITASATHEMRNVLAIVKESAGLIEDLVRSTERRGAPDPSRFLRCVDRINTQVARGADIVSSLNRFAHSLEHAVALLQLDQELHQAAFLSQRFARQRGHAVEVRPGDQNLAVRANALRLQMTLFAALDCCMERLPGPGTVTLRAAGHDGRAVVECTGEGTSGAAGAAPTGAAGWSQLAELADDLGGSLDVAAEGCRFRLLLPAATAA
jgi:C4-dicarboxylate-specific signal transduction histidine kinase